MLLANTFFYSKVRGLVDSCGFLFSVLLHCQRARADRDRLEYEDNKVSRTAGQFLEKGQFMTVPGNNFSKSKQLNINVGIRQKIGDSSSESPGVQRLIYLAFESSSTSAEKHI